MFYNKKYPENKDKVLLSDIDREDRIEEGFNKVETEFRNVKETINEKFSDMIDYPIEQEFGDNQYTKWKSGRLTQNVRYRTQVSAGNYIQFDVPLPVSFVGKSFITANLRSMSVGYSRMILHRVIEEGNDKARIGMSSEADSEVEVTISFEGRWK